MSTSRRNHDYELEHVKPYRSSSSSQRSDASLPAADTAETSVPLLTDYAVAPWQTQGDLSPKDLRIHERQPHSTTSAPVYSLVPPFAGWDTRGDSLKGGDGHSKPLRQGKGRGRWILLGLILALLVGLAFVGASVGLYIYAGSSRNTYTGLVLDDLNTGSLDPRTSRVVFLRITSPTSLVISLAINGIITACTEVTGYVHGTTLKWALAREGRLVFNANLRLFTAAGGLFSVNGHISNALFALSLLFSYVASSTVMTESSVEYLTMNSTTSSWEDVTTPAITFVGLLIVGIALSIQAILALLTFYHVTVPTWSSSPVDVASSLLDLNFVHRVPGRCMQSISSSETTTTDPIRPSERQPSAWGSHKAVRRVVWLSWALVAAELVWFAVSTRVGGFSFSDMNALFGKTLSPTMTLVTILIIACLQSVLTFGLHCCELVVTQSGDERMWRAASSAKGARPTGNPLKTAFSSWESAGLLICKPLLHWVFGNAVSLDLAAGWNLSPGWILVLSLALIPVAGCITYIARRRPHGPQPAAYGHMQTLVNLVDEWETMMYWGHKADGPPAHAGTSGKPLPTVHMDIGYAGLKLE